MDRNQQFVANKEFTMGGRIYRPGEPVNVEGLTDHKIGQLLNQRYFKPGTPAQVQSATDA